MCLTIHGVRRHGDEGEAQATTAAHPRHLALALAARLGDALAVPAILTALHHARGLGRLRHASGATPAPSPARHLRSVLSMARGGVRPLYLGLPRQRDVVARLRALLLLPDGTAQDLVGGAEVLLAITLPAHVRALHQERAARPRHRAPSLLHGVAEVVVRQTGSAEEILRHPRARGALHRGSGLRAMQRKQMGRHRQRQRRLRRRRRT